MTASISELKKELEHRDRKDLMQLCLRLARAKKENKEFLAFALFQEHDIPSFVEKVNEETRAFFEEINFTNTYFIKKSVRKILRNINKNIRFAADKQVEAELLIFFVNCFKEFNIPIKQSRQLQNILDAQLKKIETAFQSLHPDLQYDLRKSLDY